MKQNITIGQLNELSEKGKEKYVYHMWPEYKKGDIVYVDSDSSKRYTAVNIPVRHLPLLSIGQMIEFLDTGEEKEDPEDKRYSEEWYPWRIDYPKMYWQGDLCDALWEACKKVLEI